MSGDEKPDELVLRALHPRIALVFDFDETLAPNTTNALIRHLGLEPEEWRETHVAPRVEDGWETRLAEAAGLIELSAGDNGPITAETFEAVAAELELYPGVTELFDHVTDAVAATEPDIDIEFHVLTAGFVNIPSATSIADRFTSIIGGHWAFDADGGLAFPKSTVGHYAKVRHLLALAKGIDSVDAERANDVLRYIPEDEWHCPFEQMVFVGDGDSDLPAFDLMHGRAGTAIGVRQATRDESWESREYMRDGQQVAALAETDFRPGSPLLSVICGSAKRAALWIQVLRTRS